ncbi:MAG: hypothetical protein MSA15_21330 [Clostridium sp.]|nr:hypothetical protein [Clostridium sp.]
MFKELKELIVAMKDFKVEDTQEVIRLGGILAGKYVKLLGIIARTYVSNLIAFTAFSRIVNFFENNQDKYEDAIVIVDMDKLDKLPDASYFITQLRRETLLAGKKMPFEIHIQHEGDNFGRSGFKYVLCDVREGEEGAKLEKVFWVNDGRGNVYTYFPMFHEDYVRYLKRLKKHPLKEAILNKTSKGLDDYNTDIIFLDLE